MEFLFFVFLVCFKKAGAPQAMGDGGGGAAIHAREIHRELMAAAVRVEIQPLRRTAATRLATHATTESRTFRWVYQIRDQEQLGQGPRLPPVPDDEGRREDDSHRARAGVAAPRRAAPAGPAPRPCRARPGVAAPRRAAPGCALLTSRPGPASAAHLSIHLVAAHTGHDNDVGSGDLAGGFLIPELRRATPSRPKILASAAWLQAMYSVAFSELPPTPITVHATTAAAVSKCQDPEGVFFVHGLQHMVGPTCVDTAATCGACCHLLRCALLLHANAWTASTSSDHQPWGPPVFASKGIHVVHSESFLPIEAMQKYPSSLTSKHVLMTFLLFRQLLLQHSFYCSAFTWVVVWSSSYIRQRIQNHPSVVGMPLPSQLHRPNFNRRILRGLSIWVQVSCTPMRIPPISGTILGCNVVDVAVSFYGLWTVMYFKSSSEDSCNLVA